MCMLCGFGFYPLMALSTSNHTHEDYYEDHNSGHSQGNRAIDILKESFAKGEIPREQFLQMRQTMEAI